MHDVRPRAVDAVPPQFSAAILPPVSFSPVQQTPITESASAIPDTFTHETPHSHVQRHEFSLFSFLSCPRGAKSAPLFSITRTLLSTVCETPSLFLSATSTFFARIAEVYPFPSKNVAADSRQFLFVVRWLESNAATFLEFSSGHISRGSRRTKSRTGDRYVFILLHRYFYHFRRETLSRAQSSYGEEIPNPFP
jgi:hypothetical protein